MLRYKILKEVSKMEIGEQTCFKITDNRFLYADNWCDEDGSWYTTLEYGNKEEIKLGIKYILSHCKRRRILW